MFQFTTSCIDFICCNIYKVYTWDCFVMEFEHLLCCEDMARCCFFANQPLLSLFSWFLLSHHKAICHDLWQKNSTGNLQINHWRVNKGCKNVSSFDIWNQSSHNEFNCCLHNFVNKASTMCKVI